MQSLDFTEDLKNFQAFDTFGHFLEFLSVGSIERELTNLSPELKYSDFKKIEIERRNINRHEQENAISRWYFLQSLLIGLNSKADEVTVACQYQLIPAQFILQEKDLFQAPNPTSQWTTSIDIAKFATHMVEGRRYIFSNLVQLRSLKLAQKKIYEEYRFQLLHKSLESKIYELHEKTLESAHEYGLMLNELRSVPNASDTEWPADLCEIDFDHLENLVASEGEALFRMLVDCALGKMQIAFGRKEEALKTLRPYLNLNGEDLKEI
jgi:hypothetical protein